MCISTTAKIFKDHLFVILYDVRFSFIGVVLLRHEISLRVICEKASVDPDKLVFEEAAN